MSEMNNFKKDFVERTIKILGDCSRYTEHDITLLLNCLLGMVTFPIEIQKNKTNKKTKQYKIDCVNKMKELSKIEKIEFRNLEYGDKEKCTLKISILPSNLKLFMEYVAQEYFARFC